MNYLGIEKEKFEPTVKSLNDLLANYHIYYQNLRNFHWNIEGENFFDLHAQFEALYNDAKLKIDEIAERILTLRFRPLSNFSDYLDKSRVKEAGTVEDDREMVSIILKNHATLIEVMRKLLNNADKISDEGTIDMIGGFLENLEKKSWMLDKWLATQKVAHSVS